MKLNRTLTDALALASIAVVSPQQVLPEVVPAASFPSLVAFSTKAEALSEFTAAPHGDSTYRQDG